MARDIITLTAICERHKLEGRAVLYGYDLDELARIYNGIGPDRFPDWMREIVTEASSLFEPAALIHDVRYHLGGTREDFTAANDEFHRNCDTLVCARFSWYDPRRYLWQFRAWRYKNYCQDFGWEGFHHLPEGAES